MKAWFFKVERRGRCGLLPADDAAHALLQKLGDHECAEFSIVRPRSVPWHRMYFGVCRQIGENQDPQRDESSVDMELRVLAGHYEVMWVDGHEVRVPKRIAFDRLTADEWSELWKSIEQAIIVRFGAEYVVELGRAA